MWTAREGHSSTQHKYKNIIKINLPAGLDFVIVHGMHVEYMRAYTGSSCPKKGIRQNKK